LRLLDLYFTYTHVWFPVLDKFDIFRTFRSVKDTPNQRLENAPDSLNLALLYAVLAIAALQRRGLPDCPTSSISPDSFYVAAQSYLFQPGIHQSLAYIQTLLLLSLFDLAQDQLHRAWIMIGHAGRIAIDMNLASPEATARSSGFRRRTWLGCVVLETFISLIMQRLPQLAARTDLFVDEDGWEEWEEWKEIDDVAANRVPEGTGGPAYILSTFNHLVKLSNVVNDFAQQRLRDRLPQTETFTSAALHRLNQWRAELPAVQHLKIVTPHLAHLRTYFALAVRQTLVYSQTESSRNHQKHSAILQDSKTLIINTLQSFKDARSLSVAPPTFLHQAIAIHVEGFQASTFINQMRSYWGTEKTPCGILAAVEQDNPFLPTAPKNVIFDEHLPTPANQTLFLNDTPNREIVSNSGLPIPRSVDSEGMGDEIAMLDYLRWCLILTITLITGTRTISQSLWRTLGMLDNFHLLP
jgi:hypothetical protein